MNKQRWKDDIAKELEYAKKYPYIHTSEEMAERLVGFCGYGNIKQALTEFAERLKNNITGEELEDEDVYDAIDNTLKEFLSEHE